MNIEFKPSGFNKDGSPTIKADPKTGKALIRLSVADYEKIRTNILQFCHYGFQVCNTSNDPPVAEELEADPIEERDVETNVETKRTWRLKK